MKPVERLLAKLPDARTTDKGWSVSCPACDDRQVGLSISEVAGGRVVIKCFFGCTTDAICAAVGLRVVDLLPPSKALTTMRAKREYRRNDNGESKPPGGFLLNLLSSKDFASGDYQNRWLIKNVFVADQPAVIGGPLKSLKTSVACDLAISLGSRTRFLGEFWIEAVEPLSVGFISGESGQATIQETGWRICRQRGIMLEQCRVWWGFSLPELSNLKHMAELERAIGEHGLKAIVVDPLYLCLLSGSRNLEAANLFDTGPLLHQIAETCLKHGCTPVLIHHTRLRNLASERGEPPALEDLAFSGTKEFARQWLMVGRREPYEEGTGHHALWLSVGGSAGHSGLWSIDIDEGQPGDDFTGRTWNVSVGSGRAARAEQAEKVAETKQQRKDEQDAAKLNRNRSRVLEVFKQFPEGETENVLRSQAGMNGSVFGPVIACLLKENTIVPCTISKSGRAYAGYRLKESDKSDGDDALSHAHAHTHRQPP